MRIISAIHKLAAYAVVTTLLSGCVAAELVHLVYVSTHMNIGYTADANVKREPGKHVYAQSFHREPAYGARCYADGVVVDYSAKLDGDTPVALAEFDPSNTYGQAVIFYKQTCGLDDAAHTQDIVMTGSRHQLFGEHMVMKSRQKVVVYDYFSQNSTHRPDWMQQVLQTIQAQAASGDKDAQLFLSYIHVENGEPFLATMGTSD